MNALRVQRRGMMYVNRRKGQITSSGATNMPQKRKAAKKMFMKFMRPRRGEDSRALAWAMPSNAQNMHVWISHAFMKAAHGRLPIAKAGTIAHTERRNMNGSWISQ